MLERRNSAWFGGLVALGLALLVSSTLPLAAPAEERAILLSAPVVRSLEGALRPIAGVLLNAGEASTLAAANADLRRDNARLASEITALRERVLAHEQVAALVTGAAPQVGTRIAAPVLLRDPAPGRDVLVIGRGRSSGLAPGQPALGPGPTLVGVVTRVEEETARVRLLTDRSSAIAVLLERSRTPAALAGGRNGLSLEFVPADTPGVEGDIVLTSALGGQLPAGLAVGRVTGVVTRDGDLFQRVAVEPLADYRRLEHVLVLVEAGLDRSPPQEGER